MNSFTRLAWPKRKSYGYFLNQKKIFVNLLWIIENPSLINIPCYLLGGGRFLNYLKLINQWFKIVLNVKLLISDWSFHRGLYVIEVSIFFFSNWDILKILDSILYFFSNAIETQPYGKEQESACHVLYDVVLSVDSANIIN